MGHGETGFLNSVPLRTKQFLFLCFLNIIWAPVNLAVKTASTEFSPGAVGIIRWVSFCLAIWACLLIPKVRKITKLVLPKKSDAIKLFFIGFFLAGPAHSLYYAALKTAGTGETTVINTTGPLWTTLFAIAILREKVTGWRWTAIVCAAVGAYIVAAGFSAPQFQDSSTSANMLYLCGTLMECLAFVLAASIVKRSSGIGTLSYELIGIAASQVLLPFIFPSLIAVTFGTLTPPVVASLLYIIFVAGLFCFGCWYIVAESSPVSLMQVSLGLQAPMAAYLGWRILGEKLSTEMLIGAGLILVALGLGAWDSKKHAEKENAETEKAENEIDHLTFPAGIGPS